jgi:hypothetical protein
MKIREVMDYPEGGVEREVRQRGGRGGRECMVGGQGGRAGVLGEGGKGGGRRIWADSTGSGAGSNGELGHKGAVAWLAVQFQGCSGMEEEDGEGRGEAEALRESIHGAIFFGFCSDCPVRELALRNEEAPPHEGLPEPSGKHGEGELREAEGAALAAPPLQGRPWPQHVVFCGF